MAAVADSYMRLTYVNDSSVSVDVDIRQPLFGYETTLLMPYDIAKDSTGRVYVNDNGAGADSYDVRQCRCSALLSATVQSQLMDAFKDYSTKARARQVVMTLYASGSGFYPFGPDKGDKGPFTCTMDILNEGAALPRPYKMFMTELLFTNIGAWPSYVAPAATESGPVTIGSVSGIRYPAGWFRAGLGQGQYSLSTPDGGAYYRDRGTDADTYMTEAGFKMSIGKAAAFLAATVGADRATTVSLTVPAGSYPFGRSKGAGPFTTRIALDTLKLTHDRWNEINMPLTFALAG